MSEVKTVEELVAALNKGEPEIAIKGKLGTAVYTIHRVGPFAWSICVIAIGAAVYIGATAATAGASAAIVHTTLRAAPLSTVIASAAATAAPIVVPVILTHGAAVVSLLGTYAFGIAVSIAVASGGLGILSLIRNKYRIKSKTSDSLVLVKI